LALIGVPESVLADSLPKLLFPPIDAGGNESNRIYPLLPFCQRLSHISSTIVDALAHIDAQNKAGSGSSLIKTIAALVGLFVLFLMTGTWGFFFCVTNLILILPGIVMHPQVFPYTQPYILKFAKAINCPYCGASEKAKEE
jgi:hypothetical protein